MPCSQAKWLWDCLTPHVALAGRSVSAGASASLREIRAKSLVFSLTCHRATAYVPVVLPHDGGLRGQASEPDRHRLGAL